MTSREALQAAPGVGVGEGEFGLRTRSQEMVEKMAGEAAPISPPSLSLPRGPSSQGEWDLQPLPKIVSRLEAPAPRCPASQGLSPVGPTVVNIGGGQG